MSKGAANHLEANAYYVDVKIGSMEVVALVDTGAMVTTLSVVVFDRSTELTKLLQPCILSYVIGMGVEQWTCDRFKFRAGI